MVLQQTCVQMTGLMWCNTCKRHTPDERGAKKSTRRGATCAGDGGMVITVVARGSDEDGDGGMVITCVRRNT
ncbi:hypothetical protein HanIR_Chr08g0381011 [Helianthus annuus]|uniref:Uncharacterized protein n=1 Tax=Helianthus annuus TaxID=4232 RepID=A0A251UH94_HELAN|nr:hypothetical protein HanIR_Chr08g0381011 [Helianthus annuus]